MKVIGAILVIGCIVGLIAFTTYNIIGIIKAYKNKRNNKNKGE